MNSQYITQLEQVELFTGMKQEEILKVLNCLNSYTREYAKGSYLYIQGDSFQDIGIILEGRVAVDRVYQNGDTLTIDILEKNDTFGEDIVCLNKEYAPYSLKANMKTKVLYINGKKLIDPESIRCEYRSRVNLNMLKRLAAYSMYVNKRMKYISILSLKKRVITFLLDHQEEGGKDAFNLKMNRNEMSDYLNGTRAAISKILIELKKEKLIDYHKASFRIQDKAGLIHKLDG